MAGQSRQSPSERNRRTTVRSTNPSPLKSAVARSKEPANTRWSLTPIEPRTLVTSLGSGCVPATPRSPTGPLLKSHTGRAARLDRCRSRKAAAPLSQWPAWTALPTTAAPKADGSGAWSTAATVLHARPGEGPARCARRSGRSSRTGYRMPRAPSSSISSSHPDRSGQPWGRSLASPRVEQQGSGAPTERRFGRKDGRQVMTRCPTVLQAVHTDCLQARDRLGQRPGRSTSSRCRPWT